jgi:hypothetical protein
VHSRRKPWKNAGGLPVRGVATAGHANEGSQINSSLNPASAGATSNTINVTFSGPFDLTVAFDGAGEYARDPGGVSFLASPDDGQTYEAGPTSIGQLPIVVTNSGALNSGEFSSYCLDVFNDLSFSPDGFGVVGLANR